MNSEQEEAALTDALIRHHLTDMGAEEVSREFGLGDGDQPVVSVRAVVVRPAECIAHQLVVADGEGLP